MNPQQQKFHTRFLVYVPNAGNTLGIAPGSAVVAPEGASEIADRVLVHYEGNLHGAENLQRYVDRVHCAAGRAAYRYPTIALASAHASDLTRVGRYDLTRGQLTVENAQALEAWLEGPVGDTIQDANRDMKGLTVQQLSNAVGVLREDRCERIASVLMQDLVGEYDVPDQVPEWAWIEANAAFRHRANGQPGGVWDFVINTDAVTLDNCPPTLKAVIAIARRKQIAYLLFHQGT
jgi:hypothetical protein